MDLPRAHGPLDSPAWLESNRFGPARPGRSMKLATPALLPPLRPTAHLRAVNNCFAYGFNCFHGRYLLSARNGKEHCGGLERGAAATFPCRAILGAESSRRAKTLIGELLFFAAGFCPVKGPSRACRGEDRAVGGSGRDCGAGPPAFSRPWRHRREPAGARFRPALCRCRVVVSCCRGGFRRARLAAAWRGSSAGARP